MNGPLRAKAAYSLAKKKRKKNSSWSLLVDFRESDSIKIETCFETNMLSYWFLVLYIQDLKLIIHQWDFDLRWWKTQQPPLLSISINWIHTDANIYLFPTHCYLLTVLHEPLLCVCKTPPYPSQTHCPATEPFQCHECVFGLQGSLVGSLLAMIQVLGSKTSNERASLLWAGLSVILPQCVGSILVVYMGT